jgi:hypothetical protein
MKTYRNKKWYTLFVIPLSLVFILNGVTVAYAATTPVLGLANSFSILASTYTNTTATTIVGDLGYITAPAVNPTVSGTTYVNTGIFTQAGIDQGTALSSLSGQACTFTFAPGAIDLSTDVTHGLVAVYTPGVYCSTGAMDIGGPLTLQGSGTYIFRPTGALTSTVGSVITLNGSSECNIFWTPTAAITLAANTTFVGTAIDDAGITIGANTIWNGRALAYGGTITSDTDTITTSVCADPVVIVEPSGSSGNSGSSNVTGSIPIQNIVTTTTSVTTVTNNKNSAPLNMTNPNLPNSGFPPEGISNTNNIMVLIGIAILLFALVGLAFLKKKFKPSKIKNNEINNLKINKFYDKN